MCQRALPRLPWWSIFDHAIFRGFKFRLGPLDCKLPTLGGILFFLFHSSVTTLLLNTSIWTWRPPSLSPLHSSSNHSVATSLSIWTSPHETCGGANIHERIAFKGVRSLPAYGKYTLLGRFVCVGVCSVERRLDFFVKALAQDILPSWCLGVGLQHHGSAGSKTPGVGTICGWSAAGVLNIIMPWVSRRHYRVHHLFVEILSRTGIILVIIIAVGLYYNSTIFSWRSWSVVISRLAAPSSL